MAGKKAQDPPPFEIFRAKDAVDYGQDDPMYGAPLTEVQQEGMAKMAEAGMLDGSKLKLLYKRPGMSLSYVWFKSGYPLPLHSHNADCLYFIVAGTLKVGTEELGPGDGFFLGSDVPYTYVPGPDGVEVLEFRTSDSYDFKALAKNAEYWIKATADMSAARAHWDKETAPPSGLEVGAD